MKNPIVVCLIILILTLPFTVEHHEGWAVWHAKAIYFFALYLTAYEITGWLLKQVLKKSKCTDNECKLKQYKDGKNEA